MILKILKRRENAHTLFSICRNTWLSGGDSSRRNLIHKYLAQYNLIPRDLPVSDLDLETMRDGNGNIFWEVRRLNSTKNAWLIFIRVTVFSKQKREL